MRSPICSSPFAPSETRSSGRLSTLVLLSLIIRFSSAPGKVVDQSAEDRCWRLLRATSNGPDEEAVVVEELELLEMLFVVFTVIELRGVKAKGTFSPAWPAELTSDAAKSRVRALFACMKISSHTTSDFGLSRSLISFSARAT